MTDILLAMYTTQDTRANPIRLFELPNTLAGDATVTIIIQTLVTWLLEYHLVMRDLKHGTVAPIGFVEKPKNIFLRWFAFLPLQEESEVSPVRPSSRWDIPRSMFLHALRAMVIAIIGFVLLWPASVGILTRVGSKSGGDWQFEQKWAPQVFKLILGGVLALVTTPPMAALWLIKAGWDVTDNEEAPEVAEV
jgi:hypothetical protein